MRKKLPDLKVYMFGRFSMMYGDKVISFQKNTATRVLKLLQILLYESHTGRGIPRNQLLQELFGQEEVADAANNLRVTIYRLKKMLEVTELPEYDYIQTDNGIYKWESPMETWVDAFAFSEMIQKSRTEKDEDKRASMLKEACLLYRGEFLPEISCENWVIINSVAYREQYTYAMETVCEYLKEHERFEEIMEMSAQASEIYPFDEWQALRIEALMKLDRYKEAMQIYEETSKLFFETLGVSPSEKMISLFEEISARMSVGFQSAGKIKEQLKEEESSDGAFYCSLPSFRDGYRVFSRMQERNGQSVFLMIITLKGKEELSEKLFDAVQNSLRRGDFFTKYGPSQFLILLIGAKRENCVLIFNRILNKFSREHKAWKNYLEYHASSVVDIENDNSHIKFKENKFHWN